MNQVINIQDIEKFTHYKTSINNDEYVALVVAATNEILIASAPASYTGNSYALKLFGLHIFSLLINLPVKQDINSMIDLAQRLII